MKKFKRIITLLMVFVLLSLTYGCGKSSSSTISVTTENESTAAEATFPVKVTDQAGREVTIEKQPESIVSGYYIGTSLLMSLGLTDKLTGIESKAEKRKIYKLAAPELLELPSVGTLKEFDFEQCATIKPDLVVVPMKLKDSVEKLEDLGLTVVVINPESEDLVKEALTLLGTATGSADKAQAVIKSMEDGIASIGSVIEKDDSKTVYLAGNSSVLSTAGAKMFQNSLIENAGGTNVAAEIEDTYWAEVSYEQILTWNPEYIIVAADADYTVDDVLKDENLADCNAVKNGNVFMIPGDIEAWDSPVAGSFLGSTWLASKLYPDKYTDEMQEKEVADFYETYFGFTPSK